jgi:hypothetical protein
MSVGPARRTGRRTFASILGRTPLAGAVETAATWRASVGAGASMLGATLAASRGAGRRSRFVFLVRPLGVLFGMRSSIFENVRVSGTSVVTRGVGEARL